VNREKSEYVARSYRQGEQVSEIWTRLIPDQDKTDIVVSFDLPDVPAEKKARLGEIFLGLYTRLWDEDEAMMRSRQTRLTQRYERTDDGSSRSNEADQLSLEKPLNTPLTVSLGRGEWTVRQLDNELIVHSAVCPHLLGPLDESAKADGRSVQCPWHGYRFDMVSGECLTSSAASCKLKKPPRLVESSTHITLTLID
jgi:nitrite reductase/ring-hydroxylating ferredoxin subunit